MFKKYDFSVLPVVNDEERLIGIITADDIIDVLYEETTEDIFKGYTFIVVDGGDRSGKREHTNVRLSELN